MTSEKYRVVVWSTGGIGSILINSIQRRAPEWGDTTPDGTPVYRVRITGEPDISCDMTASLVDPSSVGSDMTAGAGAMVSTAMRVVNAIPHVVRAKPGLLSALDLPLTTPRNAFAKA
jgi:hypothetical protein